MYIGKLARTGANVAPMAIIAVGFHFMCLAKQCQCHM